MTVPNDDELQTGPPEDDLTPEPDDSVSPGDAPEPEPPAHDPGYTPSDADKWQAMTPEQQFEAFRNAQQLIGQRNEDAALGKTVRENGLLTRLQEPTPDPQTVAQQQREAALKALEDEEYADLIAEGYYDQDADPSGEQPKVRSMARRRAERRFADREAFMGPMQQMNALFSSLLADQALEKEVGGYVPEDIPQEIRPTSAAVVQEMKEQFGESFDLQTWMSMAPNWRAILGQNAAFRAAMKGRKPAQTVTTRTVTNTNAPDVAVLPSGDARVSAKAPEDKAVKTRADELSKDPRFRAFSREDLEDMAKNDLAYRAKLAPTK